MTLGDALLYFTIGIGAILVLAVVIAALVFVVGAVQIWRGKTP